jgi:hypothetical protein
MKLVINKSNDGWTNQLHTSCDIDNDDNGAIKFTENSFVDVSRINLCRQIPDDDCDDNNDNNNQPHGTSIVSIYHDFDDNKMNIRCMNVYRYKKMKRKRINR